MVFLGALNSRMKDFYDVWPWPRALSSTALRIVDAIRATVATRETTIDAAPVALSDEFFNAANTRTNWSAFVRRIQLARPASDMREIVDVLRVFRVANPIRLEDASHKRQRLPGRDERWG